MKTLLLLRHAKSSWKQADLADHDRPLNKRGKQSAPRMGALLREADLVPDLILCSTAVRAHKTAQLVAEACGYTEELKQTRQLYHAEPQEYIEVLRQMTEEHVRVLVVGHNPGLEMLVEELTSVAEVMPTAALAQLEIPVERWSDLDLNTECKLVNLWRPGELE